MHLKDLYDSIHLCMEVYYKDDLPKMISTSVDFHKKVNKFLKTMRKHQEPLTKVQKKTMSNILDVMHKAYNRKLIYRDTNIANHEQHGLEILKNDILLLSSL